MQILLFNVKQKIMPTYDANVDAIQGDLLIVPYGIETRITY